MSVSFVSSETSSVSVASIPRAVLGARLQLMLAEPFLAASVAAYPLVAAGTGATWCPTMATDGHFIYVNSAWTEQLNSEELRFVVAHEVLHCVLGHIDRRGERDPGLWNEAIDYATNLLLQDAGLTMPAVGLINTAFRGMTAEQIYDYLSKWPAASGYSGRGVTLCGQDANKSGALDGMWDGHLSPDDPVTVIARDSGATPSQEERRRMRRSLAADFQSKVSSKLAGTIPGSLTDEITAATEPEVDWRPLLSLFWSGLRRDDYRLFPFHRKHLARGLYLPSLGVPGPEHIVVALDTSGSMTDAILSQVLGELDRLRSQSECRLSLVQCDVAVQDILEFNPWEQATATCTQPGRYQVAGRGGTSFRPVFEWVRECTEGAGEIPPDAVVYLTDGYGSFPDDLPPYPVVWVVPQSGAADDAFPFGSVIRLSMRS